MYPIIQIVAKTNIADQIITFFLYPYNKQAQNHVLYYMIAITLILGLKGFAQKMVPNAIPIPEEISHYPIAQISFHYENLQVLSQIHDAIVEIFTP